MKLNYETPRGKAVSVQGEMISSGKFKADSGKVYWIDCHGFVSVMVRTPKGGLTSRKLGMEM